MEARATAGWRNTWGLRAVAQPSFTPVAAGIIIALAVLNFIHSVLGPMPLLDLNAHLEGALDWQRGLDPYRVYLAHPPGEIGGGYVFPPYTLPFFLALAHPPHQLTAGFWLTAECATLATLLWSLAWPRTPLRLAGLTMLALLFTPLLTNIALGQVGIFTLGGAWAAGRLATRHRPRLAGITLAAAGAFKLFPLLLGAAFMQRRRRQAALLAFATLGALVLITWPLTGHLWPEYVRGVILGHVGSTSPSPGNESIAAAAVRTFTANPYQRPLVVAPALATTLGILLPAALLAGIFLVLRHHPDERLADAIVLATMPLVVPNAWQHYYVLALPLLWMVLAAGVAQRDPWLLAAGAIACIGLSWIPSQSSETYFAVARLAPAWHGLYANASVIAGLVLLFAGVRLRIARTPPALLSQLVHKP